MMETTEQVHTPVVLESTISETPQADSPLQDESVLTTGITQLWQVHKDYHTSIKQETEQFRALRNEIGKLLHQMKELLARPGRSGQWSSFLKGHKIPRATADRLVQKYERSLHPHANCPTESISEPTENEIEKLFAKVLPKLRRVLRTPQGLYRFVDLLTPALQAVRGCIATLQEISAARLMFGCCPNVKRSLARDRRSPLETRVNLLPSSLNCCLDSRVLRRECAIVLRHARAACRVPVPHL